MHQHKLTQHQIHQFLEESFRRLQDLKDNSQWDLFQQQPCNMYSLNIEGRAVSKGEALMAASLQQIEEFLSSDHNQTKISDNLKEFKTIEDLGNCKIRYRRHAGLWPVQDRDMVLCTAKRQIGDTLLFTSRSIDYGYPPVPGVTRAVCHTAGYVIEKVSDKESRVSFISDVDVKGNIPGFLKGKLAKSQAQQPAKIKNAIGK